MFIVGQPIWTAVLSDGTVVYQDDDRPDYEESSAWLRLKQYVAENNLSVVNLGVKFRTNQIWLEPNKEGYFFCKVAGANWDGGPTYHFYNIGFIEDNVAHIKQYRLPELTIFQEFSRHLDNCTEQTVVINGKQAD